jgi:N6-adenosine-specific RNA methylase IME4
MEMNDWFFSPLIPLSYDVIVIDPPWRFRSWSETRQTKAASRHYAVMETPDIHALPVDRLAQHNCLLLLWSTGAMMPQALDAMRAWGFHYKSQIVWRKTTPLGKVRMGTGYWARSMHEPILIGTMGKPSKITAFPSLFDGVARDHSRKPDEFYALVEKHTAGLRRCDIFARQLRPGWDCFGNELQHFGELPA